MLQYPKLSQKETTMARKPRIDLAGYHHIIDRPYFLNLQNLSITFCHLKDSNF